MKKSIQDHPLIVIFLGALVLRLGFYGLFNFWFLDGRFFHLDSVLYHTVSIELANSWKAGTPEWVVYPSYSNFIAPFYAIFGPWRLIPEGLNLIVGSLLAVLAYYLGREAFGPKVGYTAAVLVAVDPFLIYQSTQLLRDILLTFVVLVGFLGMLSTMKEENNPILWIIGLGGLVLCSVGLNRSLLVVGVGSGFLVWSLVLLVSRRKYLIPLFYSVVASLVGLGGHQIQRGVGPPIEQGGVLSSVNAYGNRLADPPHTYDFFNVLNTAVGPFENYFQVISYLPIAASRALVLPYPWLATNQFEWAFGLYMVWWYGLIFLALGGLLLTKWTKEKGLGLVVVVGLLVGLGMTAAVMSGLIRWRMPVTILVLVWAGLGLVHYKRPFDIGIILFSHLLLLPIWVVLWITIPLLIWWTDRGPVFYRQSRVGKDGQTFSVLKFRTMVVNADQIGPGWTSEGDTRVTRIGGILRRTGLDEYPEVWSILKGDMSFVGPRPLNVQEQEEFERIVPGFQDRLSVLPGLTGMAQVYDLEDDAYTKLKYDLEYIQRQSLLLDCKLMLLSVWNTIFARWDRRQGKRVVRPVS